MISHRKKSTHKDVDNETAGTVSLHEYETKKYGNFVYSQKHKCLFFVMVLIFAVTHIAKIVINVEMDKPKKIAEENRVQEEQNSAEQKRVKEYHEQVKGESLELLEKLKISVQNDKTANLEATLLHLIKTHSVALPHEEQLTHTNNQGRAEPIGGAEYHKEVKNKSLELLEKLKISVQNHNTADLQAVLKQLKSADAVAHLPNTNPAGEGND